MTLFPTSNSNSSTLFPKNKNAVKFYNSQVIATSGSNVVSSINLCDLNIKFDNYQKIQTVIPAGATDFLLSYPLIGLKPTFLVLKPKYCDCNESYEYLYWRYAHSSEPYSAMTSILVLTGTSTNPIPQIVITNPDPNKFVSLEIFVVSSGSDIYTDSEQYYYIQNAVYNDIITYEPGVIGIMKNGELLISINETNINNILNPLPNRIVIDDTTLSDIIIDFTDIEDAKQILSALNYMLNNPGIELPIPKDTVPPVLTWSSLVVNDEATLTLEENVTDYFTKTDLINELIVSLIDNRDSNILVVPANIKIVNAANQDVNMIIETGTYTLTVTASDLAGNEIQEIISLIIDEI